MMSRFQAAGVFVGNILDSILRKGVLTNRNEKSFRIQFFTLLAVLVSCGLFYGMVMGSYAWLAGASSIDDSLLQMTYSAIKVPLLLLATFALTWPAFAVIGSLFGLRDDLAFLSGLVMSSQATLAIILVSLAPIVLFAYVSVQHSPTNYAAAVFLNFIFFAVASFASHWTMRRNINSYSTSDRRHKFMLWFWVILYGFAGIQMAWIMRPFIGQPDAETTFFRTESWDNAYIKLFEIARSLVFPRR